jgi:wyosine [tRNA(Phe)-imidazoG37] synthetase (radical SAM superfamily)
VQTIFGPVSSRRFGRSLGIDLSPATKQCNYDCLYCELSPTDTVAAQTDVVDPDTIMTELETALKRYPDIDVLTLTANGEPTLYPHLDTLIDRINAIKGSIRTLILSNGSTIADTQIQETLMKIDTVKLSLDCATPRCFRRLDRQHAGIELEEIKQGMLTFRARTTSLLIIEILIVKGINDTEGEIAALDHYLHTLRPDRIDLGTIDRPPAYAVEPVDYAHLLAIARRFDPTLPVYVTHRKGAAITPASYDENAILSTLAKRPLTPDDVGILFDDASRLRLDRLIAEGKIVATTTHGVEFFTVSPENH